MKLWFDDPNCDISGEKKLVAAIMGRAMEDAKDYLNPRLEKDRLTCHNRTKYIAYMCVLIHDLNFLRRRSRKRRRSYHNEITLILLSELIRLASKKVTHQKEIDSWGARQFLSNENNLFRIYSWLLDYEPLYLDRLVKRIINEWDHGETTQIN